MTMAADLQHGVFYRPLFDSAGYGGTRYFPLYFCLHALLLKLGMPLLLSAYLLSAAAILLLMLGTFRLLRELGVEPWLAACSALALLADGVSADVSDLLPMRMGWRPPSTSGVWRQSPGHRTVAVEFFWRRLLFALAWSAKLTTVFGLGRRFYLAAGHGLQAGSLAAGRRDLLRVRDGGRSDDCRQPGPRRGHIQSVRLRWRQLEVYCRRSLAAGVDGILCRSRSGFVRCPWVDGGCVLDVFLAALAKPACAVPDCHNRHHGIHLRLSRYRRKPFARRASRLGDSAGYLGGKGGFSAAKAAWGYASSRC